MLAPFVRALRPARAVARRRPRRRLRRGRGGADASPSGASRCATAAPRPASTARVTAEPGRAIVAAAAVTLYTVGTIKDIPGIRTYVVGRRRHERQPPARPLRQRLRGVPAPGRRRRAARDWSRVVGKHCESGDVLVRDAHGARRPAPSATSSPRRSPAPTATRWARNYNKVPAPAGGVRARRRGPRWSCGARPSTTCSAIDVELAPTGYRRSRAATASALSRAAVTGVGRATDDRAGRAARLRQRRRGPRRSWSRARADAIAARTGLRLEVARVAVRRPRQASGRSSCAPACSPPTPRRSSPTPTSTWSSR